MHDLLFSKTHKDLSSLAPRRRNGAKIICLMWNWFYGGGRHHDTSLLCWQDSQRRDKGEIGARISIEKRNPIVCCSVADPDRFSSNLSSVYLVAPCRCKERLMLSPRGVCVHPSVRGRNTMLQCVPRILFFPTNGANVPNSWRPWPNISFWANAKGLRQPRPKSFWIWLTSHRETLCNIDKGVVSLSQKVVVWFVVGDMHVKGHVWAGRPDTAMTAFGMREKKHVQGSQLLAHISLTALFIYLFIYLFVFVFLRYIWKMEIDKNYQKNFRVP